MAQAQANEGSAEPIPSGPRVVVGVDGSEASQAALVWALEEARLRGAVLHVVHAWQYPFELAAGTYAVPAPAGEMRLWAEQVLDDAMAAAEVDPSSAVVRQTENGPAVTVLMEAARGAELLVVGTRGHNRITGLFLGSVSQYLAVHAPCPVMVVHGPDEIVHETPALTVTPEPVAAPEAGTANGHDAAAPLVDIPEEECLSLLAGHHVGRLVVVHDGMPQAFPVNYIVDGRTVAARTGPGTKLDWATLGHVAFEVDDIDERTHQGWSVLVQGIGRDVTDGVDAWSERVKSRSLAPWVEGEKDHWIAVASPVITGRRLAHREAGALSPS
ncbi:MAG: universal stress protein [Acidimicrobiales bacterium]